MQTNNENGNWIHPRAALITGIVICAAPASHHSASHEFCADRRPGPL